MRNALFLLTSNFNSEAFARRAMGLAMFSRIGASVHFCDLGVDEKVTIINEHIEFVLSKLDEEDRATIEQSDIQAWFIEHAAKYDNMRTMKNKIEMAIFKKLSAPIISSGRKSV